MTRSIKFKNGYTNFQNALFNIRHPSFCGDPSAFVPQADLRVFYCHVNMSRIKKRGLFFFDPDSDGDVYLRMGPNRHEARHIRNGNAGLHPAQVPGATRRSRKKVQGKHTPKTLRSKKSGPKETEKRWCLFRKTRNIRTNPVLLQEQCSWTCFVFAGFRGTPGRGQDNRGQRGLNLTAV